VGIATKEGQTYDRFTRFGDAGSHNVIFRIRIERMRQERRWMMGRCSNTR